MNSSHIDDPEAELLNVLEDIAPLEWRRYQKRFPRTWINGKSCTVDRSTHPPSVSFRFKGSPEVIPRLKRAIATFGGSVDWVLNEHIRYNLPGTNWTVGPTQLFDVFEQALKMKLHPSEYIAVNYPDLGPRAYEEFPLLAEHVRDAFSDGFPNS